MGADGWTGAVGWMGADGRAGADGWMGADGRAGAAGWMGADGWMGVNCRLPPAVLPIRCKICTRAFVGRALSDLFCISRTYCLSTLFSSRTENENLSFENLSFENLSFKWLVISNCDHL